MIVLIMAGGKGTRFWPASTKSKPKQFLNLIENKTMIQLTVDRMKNIVPIEKIFIVAGKEYKKLIYEQISDLPLENYIEEPVGRNTAPCILLSTIYINQLYKDETIIVCPSDHIIENETAYIDDIKKSELFAKKNADAIITLGVIPTRAEVGYGYIKRKSMISIETNDKFKISSVERFVEKPNIELAEKYFKSGEFLWNAGIFIYQANSIINKFKLYEPEMYELITNIPEIKDCNYTKKLYEYYPQCKSISIDYAIMEKCDNIYVISGDFGWDDVGTWQSLKRYLHEDSNHNIKKGDALFLNSSRNIVFSDNNKIIFLNVEDLFCVEANGITIIGKCDDIDLISTLKENIDG